MKNRRIAGFCAAVCAVCGLLLLPAANIGMEAQAAEILATVEGKVVSGTTASLLFLDTSSGRMEIKIDSDTNLCGCKMLLPGKKINVSVSRGSDAYLHAVTISEDAIDTSISIDMSKISTVTGTVNKKTTKEVLYFDTAQGEMELKLDSTTDLSGCSLLVVGGKYSVRCARGSDAYMHAVSISDTSADVGQAQTSGTNVSGTTLSVTGTVKDDTEESLLYLSSSDGVYIFKIDESTDTGSGRILTPGNKMTVSFYRGSDAYLHAAKLTGVKDGSSAVVDSASKATVTGTVKKKSTENILYLDTSGGEMELKLDKLESVSGCKVLVKGKKVSVTCARGNDAYMHALAITAVK